MTSVTSMLNYNYFSPSCEPDQGLSAGKVTIDRPMVSLLISDVACHTEARGKVLAESGTPLSGGDCMRDRSLAQAARSLRFRRHLEQGITEIEDALRAELDARGCSSLTIEGAVIRVDGESIRVTALPAVSPGQLGLFEAETGESLT